MSTIGQSCGHLILTTVLSRDATLTLPSRLVATGVAGAGGATVFGFSYSSEKKRQEMQSPW